MSPVTLISSKPVPQPEGGPPALFDRRLLVRRRDRAAHAFQDYDFLHARAADDLLDRVESVTRDFDTCLVLGGGGAIGRALADRPGARSKINHLIETDLSPRMARLSDQTAVCLDEEALPLAPQSVDLVISCLNLHWTNDIVGALIQINHALKPDGFFAGALLGGATLTELRQSFQKVTDEDPAPRRVSPFADTVDMAGLLSRAGFTLPVVDQETYTVRYDTLFALMADLRAMGMVNPLLGRSNKPVSRRFFLRAAELYAERYSDPDGRIRASFSVIYVSGWSPHESQQKPLKPGSAKVRLADALNTEEIKLKR